MTIDINVRAAIIYDGELLVLGRKNGGGKFRYELPGGNIDKDETHLSALERECVEEVGKKPDIQPQVFARAKNHQKNMENWIYLATIRSKRRPIPKLEDGFKKYKWISSENRAKYRFNQSTEYAINKLISDGYLK
ncbi:MAG TPA: NUDIX domain-containing protein [Acidobacteriota bacterium]|nr:NUDIX domain-containing protein [Acidobacteriota bacterium]